MNNQLLYLNKALLFLFCLATGIGKGFSQIGNTAYFYKAEKMYQAKEYYEAAQVFQKYIASEKFSRSAGSPFAIEKKVNGMPTQNIHEEAIYNLAECYRNYNDYTQAEKYYSLAASFKDKAYILAKFWYGIQLRANGDYAKAYEVLTQFTDSYTKMGPILLRADRELESLKFIRTQLLRKDSNYRLLQQPLAGNTSAYALAVIRNDTVAFTSIRADSATTKNAVTDYNASLFQTVLYHPSVNAYQPVNKSDSQGTQNGLASFTSEGKVMFFTRWTLRNAKKQSAIYRCERTDTGWSEPVRLSGSVNKDGYNSTQPFVTEDGKYLLFASDRPGGSGNYDLWYSMLDSNFNATDVANLGPVINTAGDEESPYYHTKSHTLFFSSNGRIGMGGFDIYYSKKNTDFTSWDRPGNPGIPINSTKDDQYYVSTDDINPWNTGWLSSDRATGCCLALFSVRQNNSLTVRGRVVDCDSRLPIPNAEISFTDNRHSDTMIGKKYSDTAGYYVIDMKNVSAFHVEAGKKGYSSASNTLEVTLQPGPNLFDVPDMCLALPKPSKDDLRKQLNWMNSNTTLANFKFNGHELNPKTCSNLDSLTVLLAKIPDVVIEIGGYTDGKGPLAYNMRLAQVRVDAIRGYLLKKGVAPERLTAKAYGPCCPVEPETIHGKDNPEGRAKNRRVEYKFVE